MLGGKGFYRGTSILVSGIAGTGKSSLAAHFVRAACERGERALYMASEQSPEEVLRNMRSIGVELEPWVKRDMLRFYASRPGAFGLEKHLVTIHQTTMEFGPKVVVVDPITNFASVGSYSEVKSMITRLIDLFKSRQITAMFTSLTSGDSSPELSEVGVSSQMDAWLLLRNLESNGERNRGLYVLKSRGMAHSNQIREFLLTDHGVELRDVYVGPGGLLTGSARDAQEARERAEAAQRQQETERTGVELEHRRKQLEDQIARMRAEFDIEKQTFQRTASLMEAQESRIAQERQQMERVRHADRDALRSNHRA
jgi:circadian clock protein KaiC